MTSSYNTINFFFLLIDVISDDNKIQLWWGPFPFVFDNVTFYQLVYKKTDNEPPRNEVSSFLTTSIFFGLTSITDQNSLINYSPD